MRLGAAVMVLATLGVRSEAGPTAGVHWERNFDAAKKKARDARKPLLVDFEADWCVWCKRLDYYTYPDREVASEVQAGEKQRYRDRRSGERGGMVERLQKTHRPRIG